MGMLHKVEEVWRNNSLYDKLKCEWDMHFADDLVMCLGNFNGHVGRHYLFCLFIFVLFILLMVLMGCIEDVM